MDGTYAQRVITRKRQLRAQGLERLLMHAKALAADHRASMSTGSPNIFLREWRKSRNLTLEALAEQIGSKVSTISGWETGRRTVDLEDLSKLAATYGVHPAALLFSPDEASDKVKRMQQASTIAERMEPEAADEWLAMGKRLAPEKHG